ncbi:MAG: hypothetical protein JRC68_10170, partial [Deltaproteobacteria bacterium]|nr:hypothetical protein [Deltaproteobacteria bacterium]
MREIEHVEETLVKIDAPPHLLDVVQSEVAVDYLTRIRGLDVKEIMTWGIKFCPVGEYKYRLVALIYENWECVGFQTIGIYEGQRKYLAPSSFNLKQYLYGVDFVTNLVVVVEGIFDALAYGRGAVALFSKIPTDLQVEKLVAIGKPIVVMLDGDAIHDAEK